MSKKLRILYAPEFRRQMVELVRAGRTPEELAREFEPTANTIRKWVEQLDRDEGLRSDGLTTEERRELRELRRENKQFKLEREILEKPRSGSPGSPSRCRSLRIREGAPGRLPGADDVQGARGVEVGLLRMEEARALGACSGGRGAHGADPRGARGLEEDVRIAPPPHGARGGWATDRPQACCSAQ